MGKTLVLALIKRLGPHERKVCIKFVEAKETRKDLERYFLGEKKGLQRSLSLSLSLSSLMTMDAR